jgi:hypothetical protein
MESVDSKFGDAPRPRPWDHFAAACGHMQLCFASMSRCGMPKPDLPKYTTMPLLSHRLSGEQEIPWIMKPTGSRKKTWDLFVMALILYSALAVPVRVCFHAHAEGVVWVFEAIMSLVFVVDVFLAFNTAYSTEGGWETRHKHIASRYLLSWFWVDVPSAIPIELIEVVLHPSRQTDEMLSTLRFLRMFRLFRLLRLLKLSEYIARIEEAFMINLRGAHPTHIQHTASPPSHIPRTADLHQPHHLARPRTPPARWAARPGRKTASSEPCAPRVLCARARCVPALPWRGVRRAACGVCAACGVTWRGEVR